MRLYLTLLSILIFFFCGCQKAVPKTDKKILQLAFLTEVNALDPRYGYEIPANFCVKMLFEGLMRFDPSGKIVPAVSESVEISEDGRHYAFHLRNAFWSNGRRVTAYDFAYAWKGVIDPAMPTQGKSDFFPIKNVEAVLAGECSLDDVGITPQDEKTLLIELENPTPYFLELTTTSVYAPICQSHDQSHPHWAENGGRDFVSNGPFLLKEWKKNDALILEKNPSYWAASEVHLEGIEVAIVEDVMTQLNLFEKEKTDWFGKPITKLPLDAVPTLQRHGVLQHFPEKAVYWYFVNTEKFPLNNKKIRRALALAISRESIVEHVLKEGEEVATRLCRAAGSLFPDGAIDEARLRLAEGLAEMGLQTLPEIPLSYCGIETNQRVAEVVKEQWEKGLGIHVRLEPQEWTTYYANLTSGNYLLGGLSWHSRIDDPIYNLQIFKRKEDRLNISKWENGIYQTLLTEAQQEVDPELRNALLLEAEELIIDEMPVIPIYFLTVSYAKNAQLENVFISQTNQLDFSRAYFR